MKQEIPGNCLCGTVRYQVTGPFLRFFFCHCSRCRRSSGSAHAANLFTRESNVKFLSGMENINRYDLPEAELYSRAFCRTCGSPVPYLSRNGKIMVVPAGGLVTDPEKKVDNNVFWENRAPWYETGLEAPRKPQS